MTAVTQTLTEFLLERIAEDEVGIPSGPPAPWVYATHPAYDGDDMWSMSEHHVRYRREGYECRVADVWHEDVAQFIARHDPARVLAECEAKRLIVEFAERLKNPTSLRGRMASPPALVAVESCIRALAWAYADHPDYREEWRP